MVSICQENMKERHVGLKVTHVDHEKKVRLTH